MNTGEYKIQLDIIYVKKLSNMARYVLILDLLQTEEMIYYFWFEVTLRIFPFPTDKVNFM